jgi:holo-[acyl-carrier protein] synthase
MQCGIDLVYQPDFKARTQEISAGQVFTQLELEQNQRLEQLAGVFAAKEAFMKALGRKIDWLDVWVEKHANGQPVLKSNILPPRQSVSLSISHDGDYAAAVVIIS